MKALQRVTMLCACAAPLLIGAPQVATAQGGSVFSYPSEGQSREQHDQDRIECSRFAIENTGFDHVAVPSLDERTQGRLGEFFHPVGDRCQIDFQTFLNEAMADALEQVCATVKAACGGRKPVLTFYGYLSDLAPLHCGLGHSGHVGWRRFLGSAHVDMFASPISYTDRGPGGSGPFMVPVDSLALHGKLTGADIYQIGDGGYSRMAIPENILALAIAIKGKPHAYRRMASKRGRT